jgi:hypothetical protein
VTDDFGREAVSFEGKLAHRYSLKPNSFCSQPSLCDNATRDGQGMDEHKRAWLFDLIENAFRF